MPQRYISRLWGQGGRASGWLWSAHDSEEGLLMVSGVGDTAVRTWVLRWLYRIEEEIINRDLFIYIYLELRGVLKIKDETQDKIYESSYKDCNHSRGNEWYSLRSEKRRGPSLEKLHYFQPGQKRITSHRNSRSSQSWRTPIPHQKPRDKSILRSVKKSTMSNVSEKSRLNTVHWGWWRVIQLQPWGEGAGIHVEVVGGDKLRNSFQL